MEKKEIRREIKAKRALLTQDEIMNASGVILSRLLALPEYREADSVFTYVGCAGEVDTMGLIRQAIADGKKIASPVVTGDTMVFREILDPGVLAPGCMQIPEPQSGRILDPKEEKHPLMIMPGLAFDRKGGRVGFGGGYYDKYLAERPDTKRIALAFSFQIYDEVPVDPHDMIAGSAIVTEKEVIDLSDLLRKIPQGEAGPE